MEQRYGDDKKGDPALQAGYIPSEEIPADPNAIPPPYSQNPHPAPHDVQNARPGETTGASAYPPQPYHTQATTRTLHVYYEDWKVGNVRILDDDNVTELFLVKSRLRKPHVSIVSCRTGDTVGTAIYHSLTSRIDATVRGSPISMTPRGTFGRKGHAYSSPACGGANMRWAGHFRDLDLVCLDEREIAIARFHFSNWALRKYGKLELMGPTANDGGAVMEETVVTGLAMAEALGKRAEQEVIDMPGVKWNWHRTRKRWQKVVEMV
ncbi:MAG: hypothetical protein M1837_007156 [Sclerophora amabilis]|nr:MAG: hypothetical protein M1837_007156 [Sclerophora amabilis]